MRGPRRFNDHQRADLYFAQDGFCAMCGASLDEMFDADHKKPWSSGGATDFANGQALCIKCNRRKGEAMFLPHQEKFREFCIEMKRSTALRLILASVVCGGGKSVYGPIAAHELIPLRADGICWVSPRDNLRSQAEDIFQSSHFRRLLGHDKQIRQATNEIDPMRDMAGYATTYHAIKNAHLSGRDNPHLRTFRDRRMILFLDEPQHLGLDTEWHRAVRPLYDLASVVIMASGSLRRGDSERIAFLDYLLPDADLRSYVDLSDNPTRAVIKYDLREATRDHQLIRTDFELRDSKSSWETEYDDGSIEKGKVASFDGASKKDTSRALFSSVSTEFAESLLLEGLRYWQNKRQHNVRSQLLVVCPTIASANVALRTLKRAGLVNVDIAHSDEDDPKGVIKRFRHLRTPHLDALVTVAMAYEGMDCPAADVLICLTHIRSLPWIEQMIARVMRFDRGGPPWPQQFATIFAPKDRFFLDIMQEIATAQAPYIEEIVVAGPTPGAGSNGKSRTTPIDSEMTAKSVRSLDDHPIEKDDHRKFSDALEQAGLTGAVAISQAKKFYETVSFAGMQQQQTAVIDEVIVTPSELEEKLRRRIEQYKRQDYLPDDASSRERLKQRGGRIIKMFGKAVPDMTLAELEAVWSARQHWYGEP